MKRLRHQSRDKRILPRVNIEKVDSLPTLVPIKIQKRELESNSRTAVADLTTLDDGSLASLIVYSLALNQIDLAWLHHQATAADNLFLSFFFPLRQTCLIAFV